MINLNKQNIMKNYLLYFAMLLLVLCLPFRGGEKEVYWLWKDITWIPTALIFISLMSIGYYLYEKGNNDKIDISK